MSPLARVKLIKAALMIDNIQYRAIRLFAKQELERSGIIDQWLYGPGWTPLTHWAAEIRVITNDVIQQFFTPLSFGLTRTLISQQMEFLIERLRASERECVIQQNKSGSHSGQSRPPVPTQAAVTPTMRDMRIVIRRKTDNATATVRLGDVVAPRITGRQYYLVRLDDLHAVVRSQIGTDAAKKWLYFLNGRLMRSVLIKDSYDLNLEIQEVWENGETEFRLYISQEDM